MESRDAYFDRVYEEYAAKLKRFVVVRIRSVSDMEDLYQEVWKRFYERTAAIRPQEPFRYLVKIAKGELSKRYKIQSKRNEHEAPLLETIPDAQAPFEPALLDRMDAAAVWRIVKNEPLLSYQSFVLYYGFDQSMRQVAKTLHISEDAVKARLYRTRERIRTEWKGADAQ
ncbi:MAG: sigma-70 family RNA polymerase sigma factor [Eubacteriales bacterium]